MVRSCGQEFSQDESVLANSQEVVEAFHKISCNQLLGEFEVEPASVVAADNRGLQ